MYYTLYLICIWVFDSFSLLVGVLSPSEELASSSQLVQHNCWICEVVDALECKEERLDITSAPNDGEREGGRDFMNNSNH